MDQSASKRPDEPEHPKKSKGSPRGGEGAAQANAAGANARTAGSHALVDDLPALVLGLTAAILPRLVEVGIRDLYQLPKQFAMMVGAVWMLAAVALLATLGRPVALPGTPLRWPMAGLAASVALSLAFAPDETGGTLSLFAKVDALRWGAGLLICALTMATVRTSRQLLIVVFGSLLGGVQVALFGIAQHHNIAGLLPPDAKRWVAINAPGSTFGNRNMAAQAIVAVMPAAYVLIAMSLRWWRRERTQLALWIGAVGNILLFIQLYYLRLSVTRSAWGGAVIGVLVALGLFLLAGAWRKPTTGSDGAALVEPPRPPQRSAMPLVLGLGVSGLAAIAIASSMLLSAGFSARFDQGVGDKKRKMSVVDLVKTIGDTEDAHWSMRWMMWDSTWEAIKARPLGGGAGNWRVLFPQYVTQRTENDHFSIAKQPVRAHNDFLQIWSELGFQGFLSFMALLVVALAMAFDANRRAARPRLHQRDDVAWLTLGALASVAGLVAMCGDAMLSFPFQLPAPTFFFFLHIGAIGAAWVVVRRAEAEAYPEQVELGETAPKAVALKGGAVPGLVIAAAVSVVFVHWFNARQLEAEKGFTFSRSKQKNSQASSALAEIRKAIAINPDDFQNHFIEGLCHNSLGDMPKAIDAIERSLVLYPNLLNAWVNLAMFSQRAGDEQRMKRAIDAALALKPDEVYALNTLGRSYNSKGQHEETVKALAPFRKTHATNTTFLDILERAYVTLGRWSDVVEMRTLQVKAITAEHIEAGTPNYVLRRASDDRRIAEERRKGWSEVGEAAEKAAAWQQAAEAWQHAAELAGRSAPEVKRRFALALLRAGAYERASGQAGVAMELDARQEGPLLQELGAFKLQAKDPAAIAATDKIIALVKRMAEVAAPGGR